MKFFEPPAPHTMSSYFDTVTNGKAKVLNRQNYNGVWRQVRTTVSQRSDKMERVALYLEFAERLRYVGYKNSWLELKKSPPAVQASIVAEYIVQDRLGFFTGKAAEQKAAGALQKTVKDWATQKLSDTGKRRLDFMLDLKALAEAKDSKEAAKALMKIGDTAVTNAVKDNWDKISTMVIAKTPYGHVMSKAILARTALLRSLALRAGAYAKGFSGVLLAADLLLTSKSTATDFQMNQHAFLHTLDEVTDTLSKIAQNEVMKNIEPRTFLNHQIKELSLQPKGPIVKPLH